MVLTFDCFDNITKESFPSDIYFYPDEKLEDVLNRNFPNNINRHFGYKDKHGLLLNVDYYFDNDDILHWDENIEEMTMENILQRYPSINEEVDIVFYVGIGNVNTFQFVADFIHNINVWADANPVDFYFLQIMLPVGYHYIKQSIERYLKTIKCNQVSSFEHSILSREAWTWNEITKALQTDDPKVIMPIMMMYNYSFNEKAKVFYLNKESNNIK